VAGCGGGGGFRIHDILIGAGSLYLVQSHGIYTNPPININEGGFV
jgi:hypothetical protein